MKPNRYALNRYALNRFALNRYALNRYALAGALCLAAAWPLAALAQASAPAKTGAVAASGAAQADMAAGEVRKIDKDARKITLRHGEIKSLDMPPMTMVFQVKDSAMLDGLKPGDKVRFLAEKAGSGLVVTDIRPAP